MNSESAHQEKRILTATEFTDICLLRLRGNPEYEIFYQGLENSIDVIVFDKCVISGDIRLEGNTGFTLRLIDCEIDSLTLYKLSNVPRINFFECKINVLFAIDSFINELEFEDITEIGTLHLMNGVVRSILLGGGVIAGFFRIDSTTISLLYLINTDCERFTIVKTSIDEFVFEKCTLGNVVFEKATLPMSMLSSSRIYRIDINDLTAESQLLSIDNCTIDHFNVVSKFVYSVNINGKSIVATLTITGNGLVDKINYHISDTLINNLNITNIANKGDIILNNVSAITELSIFQVENERLKLTDGKFHFKSINKPSSFSIVNSDLGNTQLVGCKFGSFDTFLFKNSKMLNVFIADTTLPHKDNILTGGDVDASHLLEQKRLALSQFKKIHENRGDMVRANQYLAEEMEIYREQLKHQKNQSPSEWFNNKSERANLWLNKFSSYYGNNWLRAAFVTIIINSVLFTLYSLSLGYRPGSDSNLFWTLAA